MLAKRVFVPIILYNYSDTVCPNCSDSSESLSKTFVKNRQQALDDQDWNRNRLATLPIRSGVDSPGVCAAAIVDHCKASLPKLVLRRRPSALCGVNDREDSSSSFSSILGDQASVAGVEGGVARPEEGAPSLSQDMEAVKEEERWAYLEFLVMS